MYVRLLFLSQRQGPVSGVLPSRVHALSDSRCWAGFSSCSGGLTMSELIYLPSFPPPTPAPKLKLKWAKERGSWEPCMQGHHWVLPTWAFSSRLSRLQRERERALLAQLRLFGSRLACQVAASKGRGSLASAIGRLIFVPSLAPILAHLQTRRGRGDVNEKVTPTLSEHESVVKRDCRRSISGRVRCCRERLDCLVSDTSVPAPIAKSL